MLTLDTSGLFAYVNRDDPHHQKVTDIVEVETGPLLIPAAILSEIAYLLESRGGTRLLLAFIEDLESGAYTIDCEDQDIRRIRGLVERYQDLQLGLADAAVIACAERHRGRVLSLDYRHFLVVAGGEGTITVLPD